MAFRSLSQRLQYYYELRDKLDDAILTNGGALAEFEIRGKRARYENPIKTLQFVKSEISSMESQVQGSGGAVNRVRLIK